jgi:tetratricopeptide (TPR) repeat protein/TolB-like protein
MKDLVVDLRSARRRLESTAIASVRSSGAVPVASEPLQRKTWLIGGAVVALVLLGAFLLLRQPSSRERAPTASPSKPSIAVLFFDNNTGDASLDWLRTALADMLITDLSQSPDLRVLGTDRLYQILGDLNQLDERITSFEVVQEVAERADVNTVLLGSFVKAGESIRISIKVQEAETGEILTSEKAEGVGEDSIFPMVDDLTSRIKRKLEIPRTADLSTERGLQEVTTPSVEAYRYYVEGMALQMALQNQGKSLESMALLEKAVELDPGFAMALTSLSDAHYNLGQWKEFQDYAKRAFENADRMTSRERYYIEGNYYTLKEETFAQGIEAFKKGLELWPDHEDTRNNLAWTYGGLGRREEQIEHLEELRRRASSFPAVYFSLSFAYSTLGKQEQAHRVASDYQKSSPGHNGHAVLGAYHLVWGELDAALDEFETAIRLSPDATGPKWGRRNAFILREEWADAESANRSLFESDELREKYNAALGLADLELYRGKSQAALESIRQAPRVYRESEEPFAGASVFGAELLLEMGRAGDALLEARKAQAIEPGNAGEWLGLFYESLAQARLGRMKDARETAEKLRRRTAPIPSDKEKIRHHHVLGELALAEGNTDEAIRELDKAAAMLHPRGLSGRQDPWHVPIWYSLASAHRAAGDDAKAAEWFERIAESTHEHVDWPILYVRSFYFLGKLHENSGETDRARQYYRRFVDFWKDGDLDRERVEEALGKIS